MPSFIICWASCSSSKRIKRKNEFIENDILFTDFIKTMTGDTYKEQLDKTLVTSSEDMNYFCIAAFEEKESIDPLIKKIFFIA